MLFKFVISNIIFFVLYTIYDKNIVVFLLHIIFIKICDFKYIVPFIFFLDRNFQRTLKIYVYIHERQLPARFLTYKFLINVDGLELNQMSCLVD